MEEKESAIRFVNGVINLIGEIFASNESIHSNLNISIKTLTKEYIFRTGSSGKHIKANGNGTAETISSDFKGPELTEEDEDNADSNSDVKDKTPRAVPFTFYVLDNPEFHSKVVDPPSELKPKKKIKVKLPIMDNVSWEDFDHSHDLKLGYGKTFVSFRRETFDPTVFKPCPAEDFTPDTQWLIQEAKKNPHLVKTKHILTHNGHKYIGSPLMLVSLTDILSSAAPIQESHVASIIKSIIQGLLSIKTVSTLHATHTLVYDQPSVNNIYFTPEGDVQLASFGSQPLTRKPTPQSPDDNVEGIAKLAFSILTRWGSFPTGDAILPPKTNWRFIPSTEFFDFTTLCFNSKTTMATLLNHRFMGRAPTCSCLLPLILYARYRAFTTCSLVNGDGRSFFGFLNNDNN